MISRLRNEALFRNASPPGAFPFLGAVLLPSGIRFPFPGRDIAPRAAGVPQKSFPQGATQKIHSYSLSYENIICANLKIVNVFPVHAPENFH
jgi:hypothetical protein